MQRKTLAIGLLVCVSIFMVGITNLPGADNLLAPYETGEREFRRVEISDKIVFFHQRMIGEAIVEKDFIAYQFDRDTKALLNKKVHWRDDVTGHPAYLAPVIPKKQAEALVGGKVESSQLYIISPDSDIFPIKPTPENPCWIVTSIQKDNAIVTIIDAVSGEQLGYGIPPPQVTGFSFTGPTSSNPCEGGWTSWYTNARDWFEIMGYPTEAVVWPTEGKIISHIQSVETEVFYEIAHGGSHSFASGCIGGTAYEYSSATEVKNWITDYKKMPFTFIASCGGMCSTGPGTFSYEFRKGSNEDTATIGYCGMANSHCWNPGTCWGLSLDWQTALFKYMRYGWPAEEAYNLAMADYPQCWPIEGACMRFAGDASLILTRSRFEDVPPGYWAEDAIYKIYEAGITKGCSQDPLKFCPTKTVYRDQMAVFLGRATHDSNFTPPDAIGIFADVPKWYWAADWIEQFYADGLTKGCKTDPHDLQSSTIYYCPKYPVTRTTMAIFLLRAKHGANYEPPPATGIFEDVWVNSWAADWIEQLYKEGITKGCKQNPLMYCPSNHVTRAQMAVFLARMLGL